MDPVHLQFTRDDYAIAVQWFHRFVGDESRRRTFVKDSYGSEACYDVVNSTELRAAAFSLDKVRLPQPALATRPTTVTRHSTQCGRSVPSEPDVHFVMHPSVEDGIHKQCW